MPQILKSPILSNFLVILIRQRGCRSGKGDSSQHIWLICTYAGENTKVRGCAGHTEPALLHYPAAYLLPNYAEPWVKYYKTNQSISQGDISGKTVCEQRDGYDLQLLLERRRAWKYVHLGSFTYNTFLWWAVPVTTNRNNVLFVYDWITW